MTKYGAARAWVVSAVVLGASALPGTGTGSVTGSVTGAVTGAGPRGSSDGDAVRVAAENAPGRAAASARTSCATGTGAVGAAQAAGTAPTVHTTGAGSVRTAVTGGVHEGGGSPVLAGDTGGLRAAGADTSCADGLRTPRTSGDATDRADRAAAPRAAAPLPPADEGPGDATADAADTVRAAVVWPVMATPHMTAAALGSGAGAQAVFDDDALAGLFTTGGRLREVVEAGKGREVSWVLDPELVIAAQEMANGYRIAGSADSSNPQDSTRGTGQSAARSWLAALRDAVEGRDVWLLPFADPDLASLAHHPGTDTADLTEVVAGLADATKDEVDDILGAGTRTGLGWPADGALDTEITRLGPELGMTRVLASGEGLTPAGADPVTLNVPKAAISTGGSPGMRTDENDGSDSASDLDSGSGSGSGAKVTQITALPYNATLTTALARIKDPDPTASPSPSVSPAPQASTTKSPSTGPTPSAGPTTGPTGSPDPATLTRITALLKSNTRPVLVPPRDFSGTAADALGAALDTGTDKGWLDLEGIRSADNDPVRGTVAAPAKYPSGLAGGELTGAQLSAVAADLDGLATLSKVLADPKTTTASVHAAMARALSTAWRLRNDAAQETFQERTSDFLDTSVESLRLVPKTTLTLTSGDSTVPVTVDNGLQQPVSGLELRVTSSDPERLLVNDPKLAVEAAGSANHTAHVDVTAKANGKARVTARLYTRSDGKPWGRPMTFEVDVTSVSTGSIAVVAAGVVLIVLAALFRMRRVRGRRAAQPPVE
ncbi:DUF6049 family protein [Streptomyces sp. NPDC016845]|uniref:DUF6049 family protein n=1 Tax=Streptomyces sp. NPDC016845 TaxID=3364972 RepID=UPI0037B33173